MEQVKKGYKKTEVGVIPEDWNLMKICEISQSFSGGTPNTSVREYYNGNIPWITSSELNKRRIYNTENFISDLGIQNSSAKLISKETILYALYGATAGVCAISKIEGAINQAVLAITPKSLPSEYLLHFFEINKEIIVRKFTQGGQPNLSGQLVKSIQIPLPPTLTEQTAIATALSDVDELISNLEKLIEKKKAIKQGAMQQLLTPPHKGGKRLEGFSGEWVEMKLGEIAEMNSGGTPSSNVLDYYNGNIIWVSITDISNAGKYINDSSKKITEMGLLNSSARLFKEDTVLLAMYASIGKCSIAKSELTTSQAILGITVKNNLDVEFLFYYLNFNNGVLASQGQQGTQANLSKGIVQAFLLNIPEIHEQKAISKVLSDMDSEIKGLEVKAKKVYTIKQGMMQELLTGKTRLV